MSQVAGQNKFAVLNFALVAVAVIAIVGAASSYTEKYLTTSVGQWVMHDLRRTLYQHIHHLSLAEAELLRAKTGLLASMLPTSWQETEFAQDDGADFFHVRSLSL